MGDRTAVDVDRRFEVQLVGAVVHPRACRHRDPDPGLGRLGQERHHLAGLAAGLEHVEVPTGEVGVARHPGVAHAAVDRTAHGDRAVPVLGDDRRLERGEMRVAEADESPLGQTEASSVAVGERGAAHQHRPLGVELDVMGDDLGLTVVEPAAGATDRQREPVRQVDDALVGHDAPVDLVGQPVEDPGGVGGRVVDAVGRRLRRRPAGGDVAVAQRAQRFAQALVLGVEAVVDQSPVAHAVHPRMLGRAGEVQGPSAPGARSVTER